MRLRIGPTGLLNRWTLKNCAGKVHQGPFVGMKYDVEHAFGSAYFPKILGTYEKEIWPAIYEILGIPWTRIVNVGAGEGYYAVGLGRACAHSDVIAFEANVGAHSYIGQLAEANGVHVSVGGRCNAAILRGVLGSARPQLLVCDVEGFEQELIDIESIPVLETTHMLIELHEDHAPGVEKLLMRRICQTHEIKIFRKMARTRCDFPLHGFFPSVFPEKHILGMLDEMRRRRTDWIWAVPSR